MDDSWPPHIIMRTRYQPIECLTMCRAEWDGRYAQMPVYDSSLEDSLDYLDEVWDYLFVAVAMPPGWWERQGKEWRSA